MAASKVKAEAIPASLYVLALSSSLAKKSGRTIARFDCGALTVEISAIGDSLWALIRRPGHGGLAHRIAFMAGDFDVTKRSSGAKDVVRLTLTSALGTHEVTIRCGGEALEHLRVTVELAPVSPLLVPFLPRDLYPLDNRDDPLGTQGNVEAGQRGLNGGLLYFHVDEPAFGSVLYFQNLTAMNDYYAATKTKPDGAVGGVWPELGYLPPTPPQSGTPPTEPIPAGRTITLSDAILVFRHEAPPHERESARRFIQMLGVAYKMIDLPEIEYRDWVDRAERTLRDLDLAPEATIRHYGHRYLHPYTAAEYPDIMVQMSIVAALRDWGKWTGEPQRLEAEFRAGLGKFYDTKLKTLRRYLPNVGREKDADAVDSWYLYHPLLNLGRLALDGDKRARTLFLKSIDHGIKAAHHFDYKWPVQYKVTDFSVITESAGADGRGQTDVGGVYAWVMLQAFELTDDNRFLDEARAAIDAALGLRFNVNYQANLTAWGAAACARLWRITDRQVYLEQSYVYLASFLHNCEIWESQIELAQHYKNFLGATCLQDAPYMAIYECFDAFTAFEHYLGDGGPDLEPAARMLVSEYCKYALDRAWYYYPDALPPEAISDQQRDSNGHVDRTLSFPLEDLYPDGQQAGQVGQEVYGAGAAFVFATRSFHHVEGAPFRLFANHFVRAQERTADKALILTLDGGETCSALLSIVRLKRRKLPKVHIASIDGDALRPMASDPDRIDFRVPANGRLIITWE
jgi:hypothetical protein